MSLRLLLFGFFVPAAVACLLGIPPTLSAQTQAQGDPSTGSEHPLVLVLDFPAPTDVSVDADLGYKLKSGQLYDPDASDFQRIGFALQKALATALRDKLGANSAAVPDAGDERFYRTIPDDAYWQKLAREMGAKYFVRGSIDHVRFQGNTLIPNYYEVVVSARMVSADTGQVVWRVGHQLFPHYFQTKRSEAPADIFENRVMPHVADVLARRMAVAIQSESVRP
jgi:hypothetical protein